uniref:Osteoclast-stimulating factor 1 n=1 Tax=Oryzias latipes TaxID=8090 RepID=A0A3P9HVG4_ORYLA
MKNQNHDLEVAKILEDAPGSRKALRENYDNLLNVADYCCSNYTQGGLKALEETKQFTTQSLASVAYQISTLASSVLRLLDAQTHQLRGLESSINLIGQTVEMHKEKVARREIGILTTVRRVPRSHKIIPPTAPQLRPPYSRQPISYQELDELGHGMKVSTPSELTPKPLSKPQAPVPSPRSSFGKPVAPPTIPPAWQAPPECDIIEDLLNETLPPPSADPEPAQDDGVTSMFTPPPPPPPDAFVRGMVPPPPPPPDAFVGGMVPPPPPPPPPDPTSAPPTSLETGDNNNNKLYLYSTFRNQYYKVGLRPADPDCSSCFCAVVALYSYEASKPDDLSLTEGDIIYLTHRHDDGWCQGVLNGKHGFFPDNYVQSCS